MQPPLCVPPAPEFVRKPFGVDWLDAMTGGGPGESDVVLFVAPSGGGKTVLGTQLAWARCRRDEYALYLSYEQSIDGNITLRFYSLATGLPMSIFEGRSSEDLPRSVADNLTQAQQAHGKFLLDYDMSTGLAGSGGLGEITGIVRQLSQRGQKPTLIVVDWVQTVVARHMARMELPLSQLSAQMDLFANGFAQLCTVEKIQGLLLQQLDTGHQRQRGFEPHHSLAACCKSLGNYCRHAIGITRLNDQMIGTMVRTKGTAMADDEHSRKIVRLRGDLNRFEHIEDDLDQ